MRLRASIILLCVLALAPGAVRAETTRNCRPLCQGAEVIREMNLAREHPQRYADFVANLRQQLRGNLLLRPGAVPLCTREGAAAFDEAIRFLQNARPLSPLLESAGMSRAAAEHVADQAGGSLGHGGSDRSNPGERLNRYGAWSGSWGENLSYGRNNARDIVVALIIDDGQPGRKHRRNIFNCGFTVAGAAVGPHARYRTVCDVEFAGGYSERSREKSNLFARN